MSRAVFIAGTDTGIGKTHAACTLLHALRGAGYTACGMKPVASGCIETPDGMRNDDALALQAASSEPMRSRTSARTSEGTGSSEILGLPTSSRAISSA